MTKWKKAPSKEKLEKLEELKRYKKSLQRISHLEAGGMCTSGRNYDSSISSAYKIDGIVTTVILDRMPAASFEIIDDSRVFINGFKVVALSNGKKAYLRESDKTLMPYLFDVAFDFDKNGLALVGDNGYVTWINQKFQYISSQNLKWTKLRDDTRFLKTMLLTREDIDDWEDRLEVYSRNYHCDWWESIDNFSQGQTPLSRLIRTQSEEKWDTCYMGTDGKIKSFRRFNGEIFLGSQKKFLDGSLFNEDEYATATEETPGRVFYDFEKINVYLLSTGFFVRERDLFKMAMQAGLKAQLEEAKKQEELSTQGRTIKPVGSKTQE